MPKKKIEPTLNRRGMKQAQEPGFRPPVSKKKGDEPAETKDNKLAEILTSLAKMRADKEMLKTELTELHTQLDLQEKVAADYMDKRKISNVKLKGLGIFFRTDSTYASQVAGLEDKLFKELKERGYGAAVKLGVNQKTLSSIARELKEKNEKPLKFATVYDKTAVGFRREGGARTQK